MSKASSPEVPVRFYRSDAGKEPVREWLRGLDSGMLIVLHGFIKKTQKTPADDLSVARRRMAEVTR